MNNTTFGDDDVGYYETVAGGAGAVRYRSVYFFIELKLKILNIKII